MAYAPVTKREGEPRTRDGVSGDAESAIRHLDVPTYTSTLLIRREAFEQVGGFDEELGCFEDWDLCLRLARDWKYCEAGRLAEGRPYLRDALALDFRPNAAAALAFSLADSSGVFDAGMDAVYAVERHLVARA